MSIERGYSFIPEVHVPKTQDFGNAVGQILCSPDVWKQGLELAGSIGGLLTSATVGTMRIASITTGREVSTNPKISPVAPVNPVSIGGG